MEQKSAEADLKEMLDTGFLSQEEYNDRIKDLNKTTEAPTLALRETMSISPDETRRQDQPDSRSPTTNEPAPISLITAENEQNRNVLSEIEKLQIKARMMAEANDDDENDDASSSDWEASSTSSKLKDDDKIILNQLSATNSMEQPPSGSANPNYGSINVEDVELNNRKKLKKQGSKDTLTSVLTKKESRPELKRRGSLQYKRGTTRLYKFFAIGGGANGAKNEKSRPPYAPQSHTEEDFEASFANPEIERPIDISVCSFSENKVEERLLASVDDIQPTSPSWATVRWINCEGFNKNLLKVLTKKFGLHPLTVEDVADIPQRPKMELYPHYLFFIFQIPSIEIDGLEREQVSLFIVGNTVVTIQEGKQGDCWDEVRKSLQVKSPLRSGNVEFFVYSLVDAMVDVLFGTVSAFGEQLEDAEMELHDDPRDPKKIGIVRKINRELLFIRGIVKPTHSVVKKMVKPFQRKWNTSEEDVRYQGMKEYGFYFSPSIRTYIQDIDDNLSRIEDMIETYKEISRTLDNLHQSAQDHVMNQTMFTLTIVSTIFLPLTFLAGVYGMNFDNLPELHWKYGYLYWWIAVFAIAIGTLVMMKMSWTFKGPQKSTLKKKFLKYHESRSK